MLERKVVTLNGEGRIEVQTQEMPPLAPQTVLVEVKASLVSPGTELGGVPAMREKPDPGSPARPFGYGNAGIVLGVGEGVEDIKPGMRVSCMGAGYALHATHAVVPVNLTVAISEGQSFEDAAFAHLAATALHAARRGEVAFGQNVLVVGLGLLGQLTAQIARASGAHVIGADRLPMRLQIADRCGADLVVDVSQDDVAQEASAFTRGRGVDVAVIAFGGDATEAIASAVETLATSPDTHKMGVVVIVGGARFESSWPVPFGNVDVRASSRPGPGYHDEEWEHGKDYPEAFVRWTTRRNLEEVLRAADEGRLHFEPLVTHRAALDDAPDVCEELISHPERALGVILNP